VSWNLGTLEAISGNPYTRARVEKVTKVPSKVPTFQTGDVQSMTTEDRETLKQQIEQHEQFRPTYERWLTNCLMAGRDQQTAEQRAYGHAFNYVAKLLRSREYLPKHVGPAFAPLTESTAPLSTGHMASILPPLAASVDSTAACRSCSPTVGADVGPYLPAWNTPTAAATTIPIRCPNRTPCSITTYDD
jgi:hypothetical protein